jgi:hypothetical protein
MLFYVNDTVAAEFDENRIMEFINGIVQTRLHLMMRKYLKRGIAHLRTGLPNPRDGILMPVSGALWRVFQILLT